MKLDITTMLKLRGLAQRFSEAAAMEMHKRHPDQVKHVRYDVEAREPDRGRPTLCVRVSLMNDTRRTVAEANIYVDGISNRITTEDNLMDQLEEDFVRRLPPPSAV